MVSHWKALIESFHLRPKLRGKHDEVIDESVQWWQVRDLHPFYEIKMIFQKAGVESQEQGMERER